MGRVSVFRVKNGRGGRDPAMGVATLEQKPLPLHDHYAGKTERQLRGFALQFPVFAHRKSFASSVLPFAVWRVKRREEGTKEKRGFRLSQSWLSEEGRGRSFLRLSATRPREALSDEWERVRLLIIDEMSVVPPTLLNAPPLPHKSCAKNSTCPQLVHLSRKYLRGNANCNFSRRLPPVKNPYPFLLH